MNNRSIIRLMAIMVLVGISSQTQTGVFSWIEAKAGITKNWISDKAEKTKNFVVKHRDAIGVVTAGLIGIIIVATPSLRPNIFNGLSGRVTLNDHIYEKIDALDQKCQDLAVHVTELQKSMSKSN